jgi:GNAT superfamily N-acetyltransferase
MGLSVAPLDVRSSRLRPAGNEDARAIQRLVFAVLREYGLAPDPDGTDADLRDIELNYSRRGGAFEVLEEHNGRVVGCFGLFPLDARTCELRKMYLARESRGHGLGRRLLESALNKAAELGFRRISLETASVLKEAISLYTRYGFRPYSPDHMSKRCNQAYFLDLSTSPDAAKVPRRNRKRQPRE